MKQGKNSEQIEQLVKLIDIANEAIVKFTPDKWNESLLNHIISVNDKWKQQVQNDRSKEAIKQYSNLVLIRFQEDSGKDVEYFWERVKEEHLPFKRGNQMEKILKRKKINDIGEYDFVIDTMIPYLQEGFITEGDVEKLNKMIGAFEEKNKNKL